MAKIIVTSREGEVRELEQPIDGRSLMEIIRDNDLEIEAICGGCCSCATCHVFVDKEWRGKVPARSEDEYELVSSTEYFDEESSRLGCQIPFTQELDGIKVTVAPEE